MSIYEDEQAIRDYGAEQGRAWRATQDWVLTYEEWHAVWQASGLTHLRGNTKQNYRLARIDHYGSWEPGNVEVVSPEEFQLRTHRDKQKPHNYADTRILTVEQWVQELKAQA